VFAHKLYEILQIITISWAAKSLKKFRILLTTSLKFEELSFGFFFIIQTPRYIGHVWVQLPKEF
jgi:hypothetical protein